MHSNLRSRCVKASAILAIVCAAVGAFACSAIPFNDQPAFGYTYGSGQPLRVAVIDDTGGTDWSPSVDAAIAAYGAASPMLVFQRTADGANIVITVRRYDDQHPPALKGYIFPPNAGGFTTVYDEQGRACNFPPSPLPVNCDGQIATGDIYLNDIIPPGPEIDTRRQRLILHEMGHALGLVRHNPSLDIDQLASRYGWGGGG